MLYTRSMAATAAAAAATAKPCVEHIIAPIAIIPAGPDPATPKMGDAGRVRHADDTCETVTT